MMDALGGCWQGDTGTTVQSGESPCANQLTGRGQGDAFKTGPLPGSIAKTAATGRKKHLTEAEGRKKHLTAATGRKTAATGGKKHPTEAEGRKKHKTPATGGKKHKTADTGRAPHKSQLERITCTACGHEHPKKDFSRNDRRSDRRHIAQCKTCRTYYKGSIECIKW